MPKNPTTRATTTRGTTTRADTADPADTAASTSTATDGATSATATSKAHAAEQTGSAGMGRHSTGHTAPPDPASRTANEPDVPGHPSSPDQAAPAMTESVDDGDRSGEDMTGDAVPNRVWSALLAHPASTPDELAATADAGRSTVSRVLAGWAAAGRATSAAGGTVRSARRWTAIPAPASAAHPAATPAPEPQTGWDGSQRARRSRSDMAAVDRAGDTHSAADGPAPDPGAGRRSSGAETRDATASAVPARMPAPAGTRSARLGAGQLRGLVEEFLAEHPGPHGPVEIGHALRRSSGAIANALERLVDTGWAERSNDRPKRYRFADGDDTDTSGDDSNSGDGEEDALQNGQACGPGDGHEGSADDFVDDFVEDGVAALPDAPAAEAPLR